MIRDSVGHELTSGGHWEGFHVVSEVAALHKSCHVVEHPWPPKVMSDKFHCLPLSRVAGHLIVMVSLYDVKPELIVPGDVDLPSIEY